ncbi:hypothetical protein [Microcoleus vaginatus]|uniref:hypothetical protein n=1 Tax=Microcoleus vaginatus TaxID=119532 RepID=UPI0032AA70A1
MSELIEKIGFMLILLKLHICWYKFRKISVRNSGSVLLGLDGVRDSETSGEAFGPGYAFLGRVREG